MTSVLMFLKPFFFSFCEFHKAETVINQAACYKNPTKSSYIDLLLIKLPKIFQKTTVVERGLSDFHKRIVTMMKTHSHMQTTNILTYRK